VIENLKNEFPETADINLSVVRGAISDQARNLESSDPETSNMLMAMMD